MSETPTRGRCPTAGFRATTRGGKTQRGDGRQAVLAKAGQDAVFWGSLPPSKTFCPKQVGGCINHCFCLRNVPSQAGNEATTPRPQPAATVPCTVSVLLMMECRASSVRSSAAWELKSRVAWKLEARLLPGLLDGAGVRQGHRLGFPEKTNMQKEQA